ncbi:hypothetical protein ACT40H_06300 [Acinetobacter baumannii]
MAQTSAERKKAERDKKKEQGMKAKEVWFLPENISFIENFMKEKDLQSFEEAVNEIIKNYK